MLKKKITIHEKKIGGEKPNERNRRIFFIILIILYQFELGFFFTHVCAVYKIYKYEYLFRFVFF